MLGKCKTLSLISGFCRLIYGTAFCVKFGKVLPLMYRTARTDDPSDAGRYSTKCLNENYQRSSLCPPPYTRKTERSKTWTDSTGPISMLVRSRLERLSVWFADASEECHECDDTLSPVPKDLKRTTR
ncbi:hypothetical protein TGGT1_311425 [Toxoplasma gondii GT1]|uniref:Uncharacterized protein n=3 Tax=Toxoplasma gondii TaxID=5811 RepID=A0A125YQT6_TOXGV|nr:hypothetical protein TGGT1_311425 [Toxoplasma gondii GT1]ESS34887.1 hypothetical protein TGVEG_311425 [Toxoplasma gondii VEG]PIL98327.1 hypothetical protein TGCOUG_311425 [Toxoplasma gondii COUG]